MIAIAILCGLVICLFRLDSDEAAKSGLITPSNAVADSPYLTISRAISKEGASITA
jgi:hypothetical protein